VPVRGSTLVITDTGRTTTERVSTCGRAGGRDDAGGLHLCQLHLRRSLEYALAPVAHQSEHR
jgi:hypothetical protein